MTRTLRQRTIIDQNPIPGYPDAHEATESRFVAAVICDEHWYVSRHYRRADCDKERAYKIMATVGGLGAVLIMTACVVAWAGHPWWAGFTSWVGLACLTLAALFALTTTLPEETTTLPEETTTLPEETTTETTEGN